MSHWAIAIVAANSAVAAPMSATISIAAGARMNIALDRDTMYTPAVTIVAAWISALTGVGPAIASGSHTNSGICALLPVAPINRSTAIVVITPATTPDIASGSWVTVTAQLNAPWMPRAGSSK